MMAFFVYSLVVLILAALPVWMFLCNSRIFRPATLDDACTKLAANDQVSILIPARNEASSIGAAIDRILENQSVQFELLILDDQSEDETATIVRQRMVTNPNIRLIESIPLPDGWNGKQHACWRLAQEAQFNSLLFLDADVRLSNNAVQRMLAERIRTKVELLSGFPLQETGTLAEKMLIPLMHFILLGYLPLQQLRNSTSPSLSAGCGQMMLARRDSYFACGGHQAICSSRHDGIQLPRAFRLHGYATDIFDATDIATCRMYRNRREVVLGLLKNANEGIANNRLILVFTILLTGAAILPIPSFVFACVTHQSILSIGLLAMASVCVHIPRLFAVTRFRQSLTGALLHPIGVTWFLALQWLAYLRSLQGKRVAWRGRFN